MMDELKILFLLSVLLCILPTNYAIKCYQCSSDEDPEDEDLCGAYKRFDERTHIPVDCFQDESVTPGTFCVKVTKQSPRMFIWDQRWRTVIRRCASVTETGVTNVCNWGVDPNGVYWEECYCTSDGCNGASGILVSSVAILLGLGTLYIFRG
ncbi:UPAR/Ly6 domain-containing protein crok-like [Macrobrachium rosenbergii]|uniref:UPAR/Ly6 domain-containing protein crok-like n=1 Tax=Macrobrachium rosenbergii TaxID=79674 RepID=UPI0034D3B79F